MGMVKLIKMNLLPHTKRFTLFLMNKQLKKKHLRFLKTLTKMEVVQLIMGNGALQQLTKEHF
jgi:hypothetical protein